MDRPAMAPYAAKSSASLGREHPEKQKHYECRGQFERDKDRIIHCHAFRRMKQKTQVFLHSGKDYFRTRLTHSLEVSQISRAAARQLCLNEDLAESVALAHDLGHTPFGHTGEHILNQLMAEHGGFEHNRHSLRIVEEVEERHPDYDGLNLTFEVREGIIKHETDFDQPDPKGLLRFRPEWRPTIEAQIINFADEIAYNNHDLDDGLKSGYITLQEALRGIPLFYGVWKELWGNQKLPAEKEYRYIKIAISQMIGLFIEDLVATTRQNIADNQIATLQDVRNFSVNLVSFSPDFQRYAAEMKKFLRERLYAHPEVAGNSAKAEKMLTLLFHTYADNPAQMPAAYQAKIAPQGVPHTVCNYIAGMTDIFAQNEFKRLYTL